MHRLLATVFAVITLAAIVGVNRADASYPAGVTEPPALAALASEIVGSPVTVLCFPVSAEDEWAGFVILPDPVIYMGGDRCGALLNAMGYGTPRYSARTQHWLRTFAGQQDVGYALMTLTHEATHLIEFYGQGAAVSNDEGLTECTAYRNVWNVTKLLGLPWQVRQGVYHATQHSHYGKSPTGDYRTVC